MKRYRELYDSGRRFLSGMPDGSLDARLLLEEVCGTSLQTLLLEPDKEVSDQDAEKYASFLRRRRAHEPLAMIVGHAGFMGLDFLVSKDVLIPEQDTEILVETAIQIARSGLSDENRRNTYRILDLCCGSGCIILSLLHYLGEGRRIDNTKPSAAILHSHAAAAGAQKDPALGGTAFWEAVATDLSAPALGIARANAARLGWKTKEAQAYDKNKGAGRAADVKTGDVWQQPGQSLTFCQGDLFGALDTLPCARQETQEDESRCNLPTMSQVQQKSQPETGERTVSRETSQLGTGQGQPRFHMIVSNPPYIAASVIPTLAPEVSQGEPWIALCGGEDGLDFYRRIAKEAPSYLYPGGWLLLEIGYDQGERVPALLAEAGFTNIEIRKDYGGHDRVVTARHF